MELLGEVVEGGEGSFVLAAGVFGVDPEDFFGGECLYGAVVGVDEGVDAGGGEGGDLAEEGAVVGGDESVACEVGVGGGVHLDAFHGGVDAEFFYFGDVAEL